MLKKRFNNKDQQKDDQYKDLLVFGYSSKLFRDDEKALEIDRGKHLIPWMGDESLLIDRYDGRGYLDDVKLFASDNKFEMMMTEEEKTREKELDEERYMDLYVDVEQKLMNEEEELKRSKEAETRYGAVNFQYEEGGDGNDDDNAKQDQDVKQEEATEEFEPYVKVEGLNVPEGMEMPHTMKHHKIIAKTALFISKQTLQMEILVKTRQKDNPAFCFLNFDDRLYPYYKHLLSEIKQGRYMPTVEQEDGKPEVKKEEEERKHVEVHISSQDFLRSVEEKLPPRLVKDTCYDKLLNNLRKHIPVQPPTPPAPPPSPPKVEEVVQPVRQQPPIEIPVAAAPEFIVPPPPDRKFLIDKMAAYVAKNGPDFETVVKMKNDLRFDFIAEGHVWHNYYKMRRTMLEQEAREAEKSEPVLKEEEKVETKATELKSISFSIKNKDVVPEKVVVQNVLSEEDGGVIDRSYGDNGLGQMNSFHSGPPTQVHPVVPWGYQPPVQVVTSFTPKPPLTNGHATTKTRKRFHSPPPETCNKKPKSPEWVTNLPEIAPKLQQPVYGLKTNLTVYEPKPPSPVYGPELPPKEFLEKLASQRSTAEAKLLPPEGGAGQSGSRASLSNGDRGASRGSSRKRSESRRRRSTSRERRRSISRDRRRSRSRGRYRSRSRDRRRSVSRRRSRSRLEKKSRKMSSDGRRDRLEKKNKNPRSTSRSERSHKKSKHHKNNKKHKHNKRVDGSDRTVVLDLTKEDVVDLTED